MKTNYFFITLLLLIFGATTKVMAQTPVTIPIPSKTEGVDNTWNFNMPNYDVEVQIIEPYAELSDNLDGTQTLTFKCGKKPATGAYDLNTDDNTPAWYSECENITNVVFEESFNEARPTTCFEWFRDMYGLKTIDGIRYLNTSSVTNMGSMFRKCSSLTTLDVSHFSTGGVTNMKYMFFGCSSLTTLDLSNFSTGSVEDMALMFLDCSSLTTILIDDSESKWSTSSVTSSAYMFDGCTALIGNDGATVGDVQDETNAHASAGGYLTKDSYKIFYKWADDATGTYHQTHTPSTFTFSRTTSVNIDNPDIRADGAKFLYWTQVSASGEQIGGSSANLTIAAGEAGNKIYKMHWAVPYVEYSEVGNEKLLTFKCGETVPNGAYKLNTIEMPDWYTDETRKNITKVVFDKSFKDARPTTCRSWFQGFENLTEIVGMKEYLNTERVTNMEALFAWCSKLTTIDVSGFNTEKVSNMNWMFRDCENLTSLDLSGFKTDIVTDMSAMFFNCQKLTTLDLSAFNTKKVKSMGFMFAGCSNLTTILISEKWKADEVETDEYMFNNCPELIGNYGATVGDIVGKTNAHAGAGGYLTTGDYKIFYQWADDDPRKYHTEYNPSTFSGTTVVNIDNPDDRKGYTFAYWTQIYGDGSSATGSSESLTITADDPGNRIYVMNWAINAYKANYYDESSFISSVSVIYGYPILPIDDPEKPNSRFLHWAVKVDDEMQEVDFETFTMPSHDIDLYAQWNEKKNPPTVNAASDLVYSGAGQQLVTIEGEGKDEMNIMYKLVGQDYSTDIPEGLIGEYVVYYKAAETENYKSIEENSLTVEIKPAPLDVASGFEIEKVYDGTTDFNAADYADVDVPLSGFVNSDDWEYVTATISGGIFSTVEAGNCSATLSFTLSGTQASNYTMSSATVAGYIRPIWTVTFKNGDEVFSTASVVSGSSVELPSTNPTKEDNKFLYWGIYENSTDKYENLPIENNTTLYAKWEAYTSFVVLSDNSTGTGKTLTFKYDAASNYNWISNEEEIFDLDMWGTFSYPTEKITKVVFEESFQKVQPTSCWNWFRDMTNLEEIVGLSNLNTSEVTNMSDMFWNCGLTSIDLSSFNTGNVTDMCYMFAGSGFTTLDLSNFNTGNVTDMTYMFAGSGFTTLDLSNFNIGKVTRAPYMFSNCKKLTTIKVGEGWKFGDDFFKGYGMFDNCSALIGNYGATVGETTDATYAHAGADGYLTTGDYKIFYKWADDETDEYKTHTPASFSGSAAVTLDEPEREGYTFDYWQRISAQGNSIGATSATVSIAAGEVGNRIYTMHWALNNYNANFYYNESSLISSVSVAYGSTLTPIATPTKPNNKFLHWALVDGGERVDFETFAMPAEDVNFYAQWAKNSISVTFETEHGTAPESQKILFGEKVSEPETPTTTDPYDFLYWQTADNIQWNFTENTVYNDLTLIAKWQIKSYNVTFYNGTQFLSSVSVVHGAKTPKFTPTKIGYNFYKWTLTDNVDDEEYDITNPVTSDLTLFAQWEKQKINFLPEITIAENLEYNGQPQSLLTYTQSEDMPLQFKVNNGDYSNTLPSATNVGTYNIWYRSKPDFDSKLYSPINETSLGIVSIEPKSVTVTINSSAVISKTYDGTTNINQNLADIAAFDGLIENDGVNFEYTAQYDNPNVGSGKVITLTFKLTGNNANNYNLTNEIVTISTGEIKQIEPTLSFNKENSFTGFAAIGKHLWATASSNGIDSIPGTYTYLPTAGTELNEGIHTITVSFTPTDEYSYYGSAEKSFTVEIYNKLIIKDDEIIQESLEHYCAKSLGNIELRFTALYGKPSYYSITVDEIPEMSSEGIVTPDNDDSYLIELGTPSTAEPGKYNGTITFFADEQHKAPICEPLKFILTINIPHNVIKQLYENVIFVDNHDELFIGYQWRKNGVEILKPEATRQYYYERILDGNEYSVDLTMVNGITLTACPITKDELVKTLRTAVTPYPNPAKANQPFTLKLIGGVPENATIMIFNNSGAQVQRIDNVTENTTITLPHGYYSGALIYDGQKSGFKIIVE